VENIIKDSDGIFTAATAKGSIERDTSFWRWGRPAARANLGVKGEELPKVMYRLIEAAHYVN
jgi:hypothetical protein